jgi:hypothetical protein
MEQASTNHVGPFPPRSIEPTIDLKECIAAGHNIELDVFCTGHRYGVKTFTRGRDGVCFTCNQRGRLS